MKDRIRQIMESQHMTQQVFADYISQSPATLSSIFNGRTRPTLNIVEAIKKKIPDINIDWLLFGSGAMYSSSKTENVSADDASSGFASSDMIQNPMLDFDSSPLPAPLSAHSVGTPLNSVKNTHSEIRREEVKTVDKPQRRVVEIRVFYDDQTWESFSPAKK